MDVIVIIHGNCFYDTIEYYDSCGGTGDKYINSIHKYLQEEHQLKKCIPLPNANKWNLKYGSRTNCPQQLNGYDCGIFALCCADYLTDNLPLEYSQDDITNVWRIKIGVSILNDNLAYTL